VERGEGKGDRRTKDWVREDKRVQRCRGGAIGKGAKKGGGKKEKEAEKGEKRDLYTLIKRIGGPLTEEVGIKTSYVGVEGKQTVKSY